MHILNPLLILLASLPPGLTGVVKRAPNPQHWKCFHEGRHFGETRPQAKIYAQAACNKTLGNQYYTEFQIKRDCFSLGDDLKVEFKAELLRYPDRALPPDECFDRMNSLIFCKRGGRYHDRNWKFTVDPNAGGDC